MNKIDEAEKIIRRACHLNKSSLPSDLGLIRHAELRKWKESKHSRPHFIDTFYSKAMGLRNIILFTVWVASKFFSSRTNTKVVRKQSLNKNRLRNFCGKK